MGATIREQFSDPYPLEGEKFGVITGTFLLSRLPDVPGRMFRLKSYGANTASVWLGNWMSTGSYPTVPTLPYELEGGYDTGWFSSDNLNRYYQAGASGSLYVAYWVQG